MLKNKINRKKLREADPNTISLLATIIILLGCFIFSYNYVQNKKLNAYTYMDNIFYQDNDTTSNEVKEETEDTSVVTEMPVEEKKITYNYIGYLEIPKIGLKKGFVSKDSKYNNVDRNLYIVGESDYPDVNNGNLIIAAHSGSAWNSFFNDLYKLNIGDTIKVTYDNKEYIYEIDDIYEQEKKGTIKIYRNYNKTTLTLVTCTNNRDDMQTVYIAYLK